jgi:hypothetical protein
LAGLALVLALLAPHPAPAHARATG